LLYHFIFLSAARERSSLSAYLLAFSIPLCFYCSHSEVFGRNKTSLCFDLHFPNDWWYWAPLLVLISLCIFFLVKCLFMLFAPFLTDCVLLWRFESYMYILSTRSLSQR
jgi:hypothetical protein